MTVWKVSPSQKRFVPQWNVMSDAAPFNYYLFFNDYTMAGRVATLNKMGWMHPVVDSCTQKFLDVAEKATAPVFEIGSSYGYASKLALKKGSHIWTNDLDPRHLKIFYEQLSDECRARSKLLPGDFTELSNLPASTFEAVLAVRVFHFFDPEKFMKAFERLHYILKPGGRAFIVCDSPYLANWAAYIPEYERKKRAGELFPGYFRNLSKYNPKNATQMPECLNFVDPDILRRTAENFGFHINECHFMDRTDYPGSMRYDGREGVCIIIEKPKEA